MKLQLNAVELNKIIAFTSEDKTRSILQNVNFCAVGDNEIEIVATDGAAMCIYRRKLTDNEVAPKTPVMLQFPKLKKGLVSIEVTENPVIYTINNNGVKSAVIASAGQFPNYNVILPADMEKVPLATEFAYFSWKQLKKLENVMGKKQPRAQKALAPHFWTEKEGGVSWTVVIMPMKLA